MTPSVRWGQCVAASRLFGCTRVVWNDALTARETARKDGEAGRISHRSEWIAGIGGLLVVLAGGSYILYRRFMKTDHS